MQKSTNQFKTIAPLRNVQLALATLKATLQRSEHLPGLAALTGPSGLGKTYAATYAANKTEAYYVQARSTWTKKSFATAIARELGATTGNTVAELVDAAAEMLSRRRRPLIVDEFDHVVAMPGGVELVRDLYEVGRAPIMIIGEENLPQKLRRFERFHGRVLRWALAEPADLADTEKLAALYVPDQAIDQATLEAVLKASRGSVRRIAVNLELLATTAREQGWQRLDAAHAAKVELYTGDARARNLAL